MIKKAVIGVVLNALALYGMTYALSSGVTYTGGIRFFLLGGVIMGLLNTIVKPFLKLISFPLYFLFTGIMLIAINAVLVWLLVQILDVLKLENVTLIIRDFPTYIFAGIIIGVLNWLEHLLIHKKHA